MVFRACSYSVAKVLASAIGPTSGTACSTNVVAISPLEICMECGDSEVSGML